MSTPERTQSSSNERVRQGTRQTANFNVLVISMVVLAAIGAAFAYYIVYAGGNPNAAIQRPATEKSPAK